MSDARKLALEEAAEYVRKLDSDGPGGTYEITIVDEVTHERTIVRIDCEICHTSEFERDDQRTAH
ncbi:hypothetical protein [Methylobacterium oxalidis]|uniref:hypothetical protein n=1 Tax=Methylobacterium oxalidis TaxID=944322 RepID=UPI003314F086